MGLITEHSYGLIAAKRLKDKNGKEIQLVQLRNPWGNFEWNGDWGDTSDLWTDELKRECNFSANADDGLFWMSFEDMKKYFGRVQIAKIKDDYFFSGFKCQGNCNYNLIKVQVPASGEHTFSVSQTGERMFPRSKDYKYSSCRMILLKLNNSKDMSQGVTYITGSKGFEDRDAYVELKHIESGTYYFYVEMDWQKSTAEEDRVYCVTSYGKSDVLFMKDHQADHPKEEILKTAFMAKADRAAEFSDITVTDFSVEKAPKIKKYSCSKSGEGYNWILVRNDEKDVTLVEDVKYPKFEGLTLVAPEKGDSFKLEAGPGEQKIVMIKGDLAGYSLRMTFTSQLFWGEQTLIKQCVDEGQQKIRGDGIV